tara:strand:- start:379 stop:621 length:243 start_codon:yes stop_codon:yes gene_type:complete
MINTDRYHPELWRDAEANLIADAPLLLEEVKRLRVFEKAWKAFSEVTEQSCICFVDYPDKQDETTHDLMDRIMKEMKRND